MPGAFLRLIKSLHFFFRFTNTLGLTLTENFSFQDNVFFFMHTAFAIVWAAMYVKRTVQRFSTISFVVSPTEVLGMILQVHLLTAGKQAFGRKGLVRAQSLVRRFLSREAGIPSTCFLL